MDGKFNNLSVSYDNTDVRDIENIRKSLLKKYNIV